MKFKRAPIPEFDLVVDVTAPGGEDFGALTLRCKPLSRSQIDAMTSRPIDEALADVVIGWDEPESAFSAAALASLLDEYPWLDLVIWRAYLARMRGIVRGN
ncbi:MAG: hypothetical protein IPH07_24675 [Deltaproteobacteria bacterium]|nr:hypothetical protein [Deltaproteobacteria bacterium]